jgi:hypothetical protein
VVVLQLVQGVLQVAGLHDTKINFHLRFRFKLLVYTTREPSAHCWSARQKDQL